MYTEFCLMMIISKKKKVSRAWVKKVQQEWAILRNDLPGVISVVLFYSLLNKTLGWYI
jgi:hypothetical protein